MRKSHLLYKQDIGSYPKTHEIDSMHDSDYGQIVTLDDLPAEFVNGDTLKLPDPEYIQWLENKVEELEQARSKS